MRLETILIMQNTLFGVKYFVKYLVWWGLWKLTKMISSSFTEPQRINFTSLDNVFISREAVVVSSFVTVAGFVSGLICNTLVMMTITMTKKLLNTSINRAVLNLCMTDLLVILVDVPLTLTIPHDLLSDCLKLKRCWEKLLRSIFRMCVAFVTSLGIIEGAL